MVAIGFFRGLVSQVMAIAGLIAAFIFAPEGALLISGWVEQHVIASRFMAEKASIFFVGVMIYIVATAIGFLISKLFVNRFQQFKVINRFGGGALGAIKAVIIVAVVLFFTALLPNDILQKWTPNLKNSVSFKIADKINPLGEKKVLDRMRYFRTIMNSPKKNKRLRSDPQIRKLLSKYKMEDAFKDPRFVKMVEEGDFENLQSNEAVERMMKDDQLVELLEKLEKEPGS